VRDILKKTYPLTATDIDNHRRLRLSNLLAYLQNMATEHAIEMGLEGDKMIREHGVVWMLARMHLEFTRPIVYDDGEIEIHTWHRGVTKSAAVFRDFDIFVNGERVGEAVSSWVLADIKERKIVKPSSIPALMDSPRPAVVKELIPAKVKMPPELRHIMTRPVYYSDTDINGHMNNIKYADIACDAIGYAGFREDFPAEVQIGYVQECFPGEEILVQTACEGDVHFVRGIDGDGKSRFEVRMVMGS